MSSGLNTDKYLKHVQPVHLGFVLGVEKAFWSYYNREVSEPISFTSKLRRNWKRNSKTVREMGIVREDGMRFAPSIPFLECKFYASIRPQLAVLMKTLRSSAEWNV